MEGTVWCGAPVLTCRNDVLVARDIIPCIAGRHAHYAYVLEYCHATVDYAPLVLSVAWQIEDMH